MPSGQDTTSVPDSDATMGPRMGMRREPCTVCGMPVFLAEKLMISRTPYHRTCFRCARCNNQLTPGNYYETEEGQYCCETCPDEEEEAETKSKPILDNDSAVRQLSKDESPIPPSTTSGCYQRSLSDEEKTERMLEGIPRSLPTRESPEEIHHGGESPLSERMSHSAKMRLNFMTSNLLEETDNNSLSNDEGHSSEVEGAEEDEEAESRTVSSPRRGSSRNSRGLEGTPRLQEPGEGRVGAESVPLEVEDHRDSISTDVDIPSTISTGIAPATPNDTDIVNVRIDVKNYDDRITDSFDTATNEASSGRESRLEDDSLDALTDRQDTKDKLGLDIEDEAARLGEAHVEPDQCLSIVQRRLKIFENEETRITSLKRNPEDMRIREETSENKINLSDKEESKMEGFDSSTIEEAADIMEERTKMTSPPIVPKRVAAELRKAGNLKSKKTDVTVLNASGIDLSAEENYPKDLNPFKSDDDDDDDEIGCKLDESRKSRVSTNPFGSSDEDEEQSDKKPSPPRPAARCTDKRMDRVEEDAPAKRRLKAPQINLNPFWSDDDEDYSEDDCGGHGANDNTPIPKPRSIKQPLHRGDIYASNSSLGSTGSVSTPGGTYRKKKPAPPPPTLNELFPSGANSLSSSHRGTNAFTVSNNSLRATPRARKTKPAPPIPMPTSTPCGANLLANLNLTESPITDSSKIIESRDYDMWDDRKIGKDEANRNKQSMTTTTTTLLSSEEMSPYGAYADKSAQGKWKRKKGPAPARPIPHRRKIKVMSLKDVKLELDEIEMQQQGLERQGVRLEQLIRDKAEAPGNAGEETSLEMDVEELVLELFVLVNEKNELFRRQAELMLLRRQQRLEEEHADIEYQIRCLLCQPEATKTDFDKQREETLIQRLVEIVERRNEIVECLEMDRRREVEEDRSINTRMGIYAAKTKGDFVREPEDEDENNRARKSRKTKLKEKAKEKILRKVHKKDADKDVDETEVKLKRQNKRKWF